MKTFSLVIPAYNEEKNLSILLDKTIKASRDAGFTESTFELIIVENGSRDKSFEVLTKLISDNIWEKWITVVRVPENRGYGHGIMAGLTKANGDVVGWTHADLQCDPKNAFTAYSLLQEQSNAQVLIKGCRQGRAWQERLVSRVFETVARLILGLRTGEINAQPKIFPRALLDKMTDPPSTFALDVYLLYVAQKAGYQSLSFNVHFPPRIHGVSHWAANFAGRYKTIWGIILYMWKLARTKGRA